LLEGRLHLVTTKIPRSRLTRTGIRHHHWSYRKRQGRVVNKIPELELALEGNIEEHHRFLLELQLQRLEAAEKDLATLEQRIQQKLEPYATQLQLLDEIPGVDWTVAAVIIAELGVDMTVFQTVSQLVSWAGICPFALATMNPPANARGAA
jgi:transposase